MARPLHLLGGMNATAALLPVLPSLTHTTTCTGCLDLAAAGHGEPCEGCAADHDGAPVAPAADAAGEDVPL